MRHHSVSIKDLASDVVDTGRRGEPKPGCDCMQCFGYCITDEDQAQRDQALKYDAAYRRRLEDDDDFAVKEAA
jgi:hypothetical protein